MDIKEQATIVYRAIHTLEHLRDHNHIQDDDSIATSFARESWGELKALLKVLCEQGGFREGTIDAGQHEFPDPRDERGRLAEWNEGKPIRLPEPYRGITLHF